MNSIQSPYKRQILYQIASDKPHNRKAVGANVKEACICQKEHPVWEKGRSKPTSDVGDVGSTPITNKRQDSQRGCNMQSISSTVQKVIKISSIAPVSGFQSGGIIQLLKKFLKKVAHVKYS